MFHSIVAGTDGSPTSRAAVAKAAELAKLTSGHLHLVGAFRGHKTGQSDAATVGSRLDDDEARQEAISVLARIADEITASGVPVTTHWRNDDPATALIGVADRERADVIVVGNRGMRGAKRLVGSVPNDVSHRARCAVLIVHTT